MKTCTNGWAIIASSRSGELSYVLPGMANSLFTHNLPDGLRGQPLAYGDEGCIRNRIRNTRGSFQTEQSLEFDSLQEE